MRPRGFTLVELAIVLVIVGIIAVMTLTFTTTSLNVQRNEVTRVKIRAVETAIVNFVAVNRRLPCPALGTQPTGPTAGLEIRNAVAPQDDPCGSQQHGVIPWVALGLTVDDGQDAWGGRLTYRVDPVLTRDNAMDMSQCDPAGQNLTPGTDGLTPARTVCGACTSVTLNMCVPPAEFLDGRGLTIRDGVGGAILMDPAGTPATGAAFFLVSHGENRGGGYSPAGTLLAAAPALGTAEAHNAANLLPPSYYVDAPTNYSTTNARFDDIVARPTVISVVQRAFLGPRSHL